MKIKQDDRESLSQFYVNHFGKDISTLQKKETVENEEENMPTKQSTRESKENEKINPLHISFPSPRPPAPFNCYFIKQHNNKFQDNLYPCFQLF